MTGEVPKHNHHTRDIKPPGQCPSCDRYHLTRRQVAIDSAYQEALCGPDVGNDKSEAERLASIARILSPFQTEIG